MAYRTEIKANSHPISILKEKSEFKLASLIEKIIEAIKLFIKGPDQKHIQQQAIAIFTARPKTSISWEKDLNMRKKTVVDLFCKFNEKNPKALIAEITIYNIQKLFSISYADICSDPEWILNNYKQSHSY